MAPVFPSTGFIIAVGAASDWPELKKLKVRETGFIVCLFLQDVGNSSFKKCKKALSNFASSSLIPDDLELS